MLTGKDCGLQIREYGSGGFKHDPSRTVDVGNESLIRSNPSFIEKSLGERGTPFAIETKYEGDRDCHASHCIPSVG